MKNNNRFLVSASLSLVLAIFAACGSGTTNTNTSVTANSANTNSVTTGGANSKATETTKKETSPLTIAPGELLADSANADKYQDRELTVTGVLMEIDPSPAGYVNVGEKGKKDYVKCEGSHTDYARERFEIRELEGKGKTMTGTVKGTFKEFKTDGSAKVAVLTSCTLSDVKK